MKMKEFGPGGARVPGAPLRSANVLSQKCVILFKPKSCQYATTAEFYLFNFRLYDFFFTAAENFTSIGAQLDDHWFKSPLFILLS